MLGIRTNVGGLVDLVTRKATGDAARYVEKLAANNITGRTVNAIRNGLEPYFAAGGVKGMASGIKNAAQMNTTAARAAEEARLARALGASGEAELLEHEAGMFRDLTDTQFADAMTAAAAPAKAVFGGAKTWFVPQKRAGGGRNWSDWGKRMGLAAGGAFIAGTGWRFATGQGGPFTNNYGQFDIAGIPFI